MKRSIFQTLVIAVLLMSVAKPIHAEPVNFARVPGDAMWMAHVDISAAVNSQYGQLAIADMQLLGMQTKLEALKSLLGLDPMKDFDSITAFGKTLGDKESTLIVQMGPDIGKLEEIAKLAEEYQQARYKGYAIHSWIDKRNADKDAADGAGRRVHCAVVPLTGATGKTVLVFSPDNDRVTAGIDRIIAGRSVPAARQFAAQPAPGSIVFVSAINFDQLAAGQPNRPAIVNVVKSLTCDIGEANGNAFVSMNLVTTDEQQAANLQQMAMGLLALVKMNEDPATKPMVDLVNKINITVNAATVQARAEYPSKQLYELVKQFKTERDRVMKNNEQQAKPAPATVP